MTRVITVAIATSEPFDFFARLAYAKCNINVITQLARDLTDIYALSRGCCTPSEVVRIYQSNPSRLCYYIYIHIYIYIYIYIYINCKPHTPLGSHIILHTQVTVMYISTHQQQIIFIQPWLN